MIFRMAGAIALSCVCGVAFAYHGFDPVTALAPTAVGAESIAVGDVTGDGLDDVVALGEGSNAYYRGKLVVYAQLAAGGFSAPAIHAYSEGPGAPFKLALADLDADGALDVVVSHEFGGWGRLALLRNEGGYFALAGTAQAERSEALLFMDVDEDGHLDIVADSAFTFDEIQVFHGDGSGGIRDQAVYPVAAWAHSFRLADIDNDGKRDLVYTTLEDGLFVQRHQDGGFGSQPSRLPSPGESFSGQYFSVGDFNSDGRTDIATSTWESNRYAMRVYPQEYNGSYRRSHLIESDSIAHPLLAHDMDGDGRTDLVMVRHDNTIDVFLNRPGGFLPRASFMSGSSPHAVAMGDLNNDGLADIAMAQGSVSLLLSRGTPIESDLAVFMGLVPNAAALRVENRGALASLTHGVELRISPRVGRLDFGELPEGCWDYSWPDDNNYRIYCGAMASLAPGEHHVYAFPFTLSGGGARNVVNARGQVYLNQDLRHDNNVATQRLFIPAPAPAVSTGRKR